MFNCLQYYHFLLTNLINSPSFMISEVYFFLTHLQSYSTFIYSSNRKRLLYFAWLFLIWLLLFWKAAAEITQETSFFTPWHRYQNQQGSGTPDYVSIFKLPHIKICTYLCLHRKLYNLKIIELAVHYLLLSTIVYDAASCPYAISLPFHVVAYHSPTPIPY